MQAGRRQERETGRNREIQTGEFSLTRKTPFRIVLGQDND